MDLLATSNSLCASASTWEPLPCSSSVQQLSAWLAWWITVCCRFISLVKTCRHKKVMSVLCDNVSCLQETDNPQLEIHPLFTLCIRCITWQTNWNLVWVYVKQICPNLHLLFHTEETGCFGFICPLENIFFSHNDLLQTGPFSFFHPGGPIGINTKSKTNTSTNTNKNITGHRRTTIQFLCIFFSMLDIFLNHNGCIHTKSGTAVNTFQINFHWRLERRDSLTMLEDCYSSSGFYLFL